MVNKHLYLARLIDTEDLVSMQKMIQSEDQILLWPGLCGSWLHYAAGEGKLSAMKLLIDSGMSVDIHDSEGREITPLCNAIENNQVEAVRWLLSQGAQFSNALISAVIGGSEEIIQILLAAGADPAKRTGNPPRNAYEQALRLGKTELAALLAPKNKDFNIAKYLSSQFGEPSNSEPRRLPLDAPFSLGQFVGEASIVVCTVGLSSYDMGLPYRCEVMVRLPGGWPNTPLIGEDPHWPVDFLLDIAISAMRSPILQTFHTIGNGEPPQSLSKDVLFCGVVLVPENYEDMPFDGEGNPIKIFSLQPIYAEEITLAKRGIEKLVKAFDKSGFSPKAVIGKTRKNLAKSWWKR